MRIFAWIAKYVKRYPWTIIIISLGLSLFLGLGMLMLKGDVTYPSLCPRTSTASRRSRT